MKHIIRVGVLGDVIVNCALVSCQCWRNVDISRWMKVQQCLGASNALSSKSAMNTGAGFPASLWVGLRFVLAAPGSTSTLAVLHPRVEPCPCAPSKGSKSIPASSLFSCPAAPVATGLVGIESSSASILRRRSLRLFARRAWRQER